jgi:hypothetical protein
VSEAEAAPPPDDADALLPPLGPLGALRTLVALLGGSLVGGAFLALLAFVLGLSEGPGPRPLRPLTAQEVQWRASQEAAAALGSDDAALVVVIFGVASVGLLALGLGGWALFGRRRWWRDDVEAIYAEPAVRWVGVPAAGALLGGVAYLVLENATATAEYPAKYDELLPFMGGMAVLTLIFYVAAWGVTSVIRAAFARPPRAS